MPVLTAPSDWTHRLPNACFRSLATPTRGSRERRLAGSARLDLRPQIAVDRLARQEPLIAVHQPLQGLNVGGKARHGEQAEGDVGGVAGQARHGAGLRQQAARVAVHLPMAERLPLGNVGELEDLRPRLPGEHPEHRPLGMPPVKKEYSQKYERQGGEGNNTEDLAASTHDVVTHLAGPSSIASPSAGAAGKSSHRRQGRACHGSVRSVVLGTLVLFAYRSLS